jgi:anti-sigma factor RsiW
MSDLITAPAHDDLEAYVLGALDPEDRERFAVHLSDCAECSAGAASYVPVMHALRMVPAAVPPPPPSTVPVPAARRFRFQPFAYAMAAALLLVVGASIQYALEPRGDDLLVRVAGMMADGPRQVSLLGPSARGRALVGHRGLRTAFVVRGLAAAPAGEAYHVWTQGGQTRFVGTLVPASEGLSVLLVNGNQLAGTRAITVDLERADAQQTPTGPPVLTGTVQ